jgi:hypothetical protein
VPVHYKVHFLDKKYCNVYKTERIQDFMLSMHYKVFEWPNISPSFLFLFYSLSFYNFAEGLTRDGGQKFFMSLWPTYYTLEIRVYILNIPQFKADLQILHICRISFCGALYLAGYYIFITSR